MMTLNELRKNKDLLNNIDWAITSENNVDMDREWSTRWKRGNEESLYFVIFDQEIRPQATLIKRNMKEAIELAKIPVPKDLFQEACEEAGNKTGGTGYPLNDTLKQWVSTVLKNAPGMLQ